MDINKKFNWTKKEIREHDHKYLKVLNKIVDKISDEKYYPFVLLIIALLVWIFL